ncbi:hypothetical protein PRK78_001430 [Emydomyces testavorans]|uniref:Uncharacterized protein n=1 Tax=Emydomyces testavorans TaxID=2070801 RepID=A0AAF0DCV5_9EURO|nr:hypothetical protein PRK78_001430 [Emydomyces testavorans]
MVLVTSGTISVAISSSIIGLFTFLLFISGYALQQQSVRNIQAALPKYTAPASTPTLLPTPFVKPAGGEEFPFAIDKREGISTSPFDTLPNHKQGDQQAPIDGATQTLTPDKRAYLQILSKPSAADICSTLLFSKTIALNSTLDTDRVVIYPESWELNSPTANIAAALRILRASRKQYNIILHAIDMDDPRDRHPSTTRLLKRASAKLRAYERLLYLRAPGVAVDVSTLDQLMLSLDESHLFSEASSSSRWCWWRWLFNNGKGGAKTWVDTQLSITSADLPSTVLVVSRYLRPGILSRRSHILGSSVRRNYVDSVMGSLSSHNTKRHGKEQAYVYFEKNKNRLQERSSVYYLHWREELERVCQGVDLSD